MDKPITRLKEAINNIRSTKENFTMDLELMIMATKKDRELSKVIEIVTKKKLNELPIERFHTERLINKVRSTSVQTQESRANVFSAYIMHLLQSGRVTFPKMMADAGIITGEISS